MDFQREVIERSHQVPVVVDFWAPWCGPCRVLGPVIEQLAEEAQGRWELVKLNTEEETAIAQQYQIMSIPAVKMFVDGQPVAEFVGALPRHQIEAWIEDHLPDSRRETLQNITARLGQKDGQALEELREFVEQNPDLEDGRILLAGELVGPEPEKARELVRDMTSGTKFGDQGDDIRSLADLMTCPLEGNENINQKLKEARKALKKQNHELAIQNLIEAVMIDKNYCDELPRRATVALFRLLGHDHPLTLKYQRNFSMALY